jgi:ABC-type nickel/cobalt efflux system permease component RcnA
MAFVQQPVNLLAGLIASLNIQNDDLTHAQFTVLLLLAVGTMVQVALVAFVVTPVVMRGRFKTYSFTKAVVFMESCAVISILLLALWLIWLLHDQRILFHRP